MSRWDIVKENETKLLKFIAKRGKDSAEIIEMNQALLLCTKYFYANECMADEVAIEYLRLMADRKRMEKKSTYKAIREWLGGGAS